MKISVLGLTVLCIALSGCGSAVVVSSTAQSKPYDKFKIVADDFESRSAASSLTANAMRPEEANKRFTLWRGDPYYRFEEGASYFRTIALPPPSKSRHLEISSYYSKDFPTTLFVPSLIFLNASGKAIEKRAAPAYKITNGLWEHIQLSEPVPSDAAFVVIYTTAERVSQRMVFMTYSMTGVLPAPSFASHDTGFGGHYEGILKVVVEIDQ